MPRPGRGSPGLADLRRTLREEFQGLYQVVPRLIEGAVIGMEPELTDEQAKIVEFDPTAGHQLVLARPGSGKTRTLAARARRLLHDGIDPQQLLAVTFSKRAAAELQDRLPEGGIWAGTFHAVCADILEKYGSAIGVKWPFRIVDEAGAREFLLRALSEEGCPLPQEDGWRRHYLKEFESRIERRKRLGVERAEPADGDRLDADLVGRIDETYCRLLRDANTLDFADLITHAVQAIEQDDVTADALRRRLSHLLVDEFHDVSPDQYRLIALLAPPRSGSQVFVVGDPDQAIYTWRGADAIETLRKYRSEFRPAEFRLTVNFRSRARIVDAADALMRDFGQTHTSVPRRPGNVRPSWCGFGDSLTEAREVAASIRRAMSSGSYSGYGEFAVLYRTHKIGDTLEAELLRAGIPICRVQPDRFFHDPDAKESLRYLELAFGLQNEGFEPALNWPRVIVDEITMVHLRRLAEKRGQRLTELVRQIDDLDDEISPLTRGVMRQFLHTVDHDLEALAGLPMSEALDPFLEVLRTRRGPIPNSDRESIRDTLDLLEPSLRDALDALLVATRTALPILLRVLPGSDAAAAAIIVRHSLRWYFNLEVRDAAADPASPDVFILTLGEEQERNPYGIGIGRLETTTVTFGVATRTWRLMQMLIMAHETLDREPFVLVDVETSNKNPETAEILEFAAVPFEEGVIAGPGYASLVRPSSPDAIDPRSTDVHGLRWADVSGAPEPLHVLPRLLEQLDGTLVVGHNIEDFDLPVLRRAAERAGLVFASPLTVDTLTMSRRLWPGKVSYRLDNLVHPTGPDAVQHHRAHPDSMLTGKLFSALLLASRRDREIDVLSECLPLVAVSILTGGDVVAYDNIILAGIGARAFGFGQGTDLFTEWEQTLERTGDGNARALMASAVMPSPEEDERWQRLVEGWKTTVEAFSLGASAHGIAHFLHHAALAQPVDALPRGRAKEMPEDPRLLASSERVALMTVHSAKGLEWPIVFLVGVEDDQFPHYRTNSEEGLAEERRTLYVGMTRAQDRLLIFSADERDGFPKRRSRFLGPLIGNAIDKRRPGRSASDGS